MDFKNNWIIAEIGSVHDGSFGNAQKLIEAAAAAGANCVKFQTHIADAETLENAPTPGYFKAEPRKAYFKRTGFSQEQWIELNVVAKRCGVEFLSSPFALEAVDLLENVGVSAYKIPSGEVTNLPLLAKVAATRKPALLSSGMSTWKELEAAVKVLSNGGPLCVMQCTSAYPCPSEKVGLNVLEQIKDKFPGVYIGYSDHTLGMAAGIAAATLGATVVEKHFTFSKLMYGSDAKHSMEPPEFKLFCEALKETWAIIKNPIDKDKLTSAEMKDMKMIFQKSIVLSQNLPAGHKLTDKDLAFKKPGDGISADQAEFIIGRVLKKALPYEHKLRIEDLV